MTNRRILLDLRLQPAAITSDQILAEIAALQLAAQPGPCYGITPTPSRYVRAAVGRKRRRDIEAAVLRYLQTGGRPL